MPKRLGTLFLLTSAKQTNKEVSIGYTTYFNGDFVLDKPLTVAHKKFLEDFAEERHEGKDAKGNNFPGIWCQWVPNEEGTSIVHDEGEKFYAYDAWIEYLIDEYLAPWGYIANGCISWDGEESDDDGIIDVINNVVTCYNIHERANQLEAGLDKVLSLVPNQLPLFMGINPALDKKVKALLSATADVKIDIESGDTKYGNETKE